MLNQSIFYIKILAVFVLAGREGDVRCCGQGLAVGTRRPDMRWWKGCTQEKRTDCNERQFEM